MKNISLFTALGLSIYYVNGAETTKEDKHDKEKKGVSVPSEKTDDPDEILLNQILEEEHEKIERAKKNANFLLQIKPYNKPPRHRNLSAHQSLPLVK